MITETERRPALRTIVASVFALLVLPLTACGSGTSAATPSTDQGYTVASKPTLTAGSAVPAPTARVVLTITGAVSGGPVNFDMATLESLGLVEYAAFDKQAEGRKATFRGVLLSTLLDVVGAGNATTLRTTALNDYTVEIPASDAKKLPVMLATSVDGQRMSVERYGPVRVIYPTEGVTLDPAVYDPRWIWQLKSIEVK